MNAKILSLFLLFITFSVSAQEGDGMIYDSPAQMPTFPGGGAAMDQYLQENLVYPANAKANGIQGKVYVQFIVEKDGRITNVEVRRGVNEELDAEAMRLVKEMPNWKPGSNRGKIVRTRYTLPIIFRI